MKRLFLFSVLAVFAVSCGNSAKEEAEEERKRDSTDKVQLNKDSIQVAEMERRDDSARAANEAKMKDSANHEGHDHSDPNHKH